MGMEHVALRQMKQRRPVQRIAGRPVEMAPVMAQKIWLRVVKIAEPVAGISRAVPLWKRQPRAVLTAVLVEMEIVARLLGNP